MKSFLNIKSVFVFGLICCTFFTFAQIDPDDTINRPVIELPFPIDPTLDPTQTEKQSFDLGDPSNVKQTIVYDPITGTYVFKEIIGSNDVNYRNPSMMTLEEYLEYDRQKSMRDNWKDKVEQQTKKGQPLISPIKIPSKAFANIFGSDEITIKPQGSVEISLGVNSSRYDNPLLPVRQRKITRFDFQQKIQVNLVGQIGTKLKLNTSYNTQAQFDFDNITKLNWTGQEDQIMQAVSLGQVALTLPTSLIQGSQTLFGAKTQMKFGHLTVEAIAASSKGKRTEINVQGGAQTQNFELGADNYEANRHYFLNLFYQQKYDNSMSTLPIPSSETSITRMEVWMTNRTNNTENNRNIVAFSDLGESNQANCQGTPGGYIADPLPDNQSNALYNWASTNPSIRGFVQATVALTNQVAAPGPFFQAREYEKVENARKLSESEYTYNNLLGYISLNLPLNNDEVLGVSYEYTYRGATYQVGEFSTDGVVGSDALIMKLIKPTITNPSLKIWDLMMKNVYSIGAYSIDQQGFRLDVNYNNPETSLPVIFIPIQGVDDKQIVSLIGMDKLSQNQQAFSDGVFDFVPAIIAGNKVTNGPTINTRNGRIYFSTVEPFGKTLRDQLLLANVPTLAIDRIVFSELYDSTKTAAQQIPSKNRFLFRGQYQSSVTSDIPLNALNVPQGAVTVTAGGVKLVEGTDFTVDYNLGRVKILNTGILESNTPIKISIESNSVFGFQAKSILGTRFNYRFDQDFNIGATWVRMMERPVTQKVDIGSEPFSNNMLGFDFSIRRDVPLLTRLVDALPFITTKAPSSIAFNGEFAHLIPGTPRAIKKTGISYVDDFEASQSTIDLRSPTSWRLASIPQGQTDLFPEASLNDNLRSGYNRAKTPWYLIDLLFYANSDLTPANIKADPTLTSDSRTKLVTQTELFPNLQQAYGTNANIPILELAHYPKERGMYNLDTANVGSDGLFTNPANRWGGIMRPLSTNDFELSNIEYIQVWVLDPFNSDMEAADPNTQHSGGDFYINLGNISEDILPDSRKSYENGLPGGANISNVMVNTNLGRVSTQQVVVNAFDADEQARTIQDVGLDGWSSADETIFYANYVNWVNSNATLTPAAKAKMLADPSSDDYRFYRSDISDNESLNVLERYKWFNNLEGNSPTVNQSNSINSGGYPTQATNLPDVEDINQDNTVSQSEAYFQYKLSLRPQDMVIGKNYITNISTVTVGTKTEKWYQMKIPLRQPSKVVNGIQDFRSIRFMRMFFKDWNEEVVLRFARLEFIRGEWRRFNLDLTEVGESITPEPGQTTFDIGAVNIEENSGKQPVNYKIPPGIQREIDPSQQQQRQLNEQSMSLIVCNLKDGDARAAYRNVQFDVRNYKKFKMFAHAEQLDPNFALNAKDATVFMRLGSDFTENYYEYEMPLFPTQSGATSDADVWPDANQMEIIFEELTKAKDKRNQISGTANSGVSFTTEYVIADPNFPGHFIKVKGAPNLQLLKTIMIGIRNPKKGSNAQDDGLPKCLELWVNELRLTDFISEGGSAALARTTITLADFATVTGSATYSGYNWGSVESRVQDRQRNEKINADFTASMQLGKFFGSRAKISLPFFYGYNVGIINPEFDPFNPDIKLSEYSTSDRQKKARDGQDYTERRGYNFTNVRIERGGSGKPRAWDIANWSASYAFNENYHRDFNLAFDKTTTRKAGLNYNHSGQPKLWEPFKKVKFMQKSKWWNIIKDANLYLGVKNLSMTNDLARNYNERKVKNNLAPTFDFQPVYVKNFTWNRTFGFKYDITRNLKFDLTANNRAIFEEAQGQVSKKGNPSLYREFQDSIKRQLSTLGKTMNYNHNYNISYNLPLDKIPALDWVSSNVKYSGTFDWQRAPLGQQEFGNIIQNSRNINATAQANFTTLYNKSKFLKRVNDGGKTSKMAIKTSGVKKGETESAKPTTPEKPESKRLKRLQAKIVKLEAKVADTTLSKKELVHFKDKLKSKKEKEKELLDRLKARQGKVKPLPATLARVLMSVRNVSTTYTLTDGTLLPGYTGETRLLGYNKGIGNTMTGFLLGQQSRDIYGRDNGYDVADGLASGNLLVRNPLINSPHTKTHTQNFTGRATLEPFKDLTIDLNFSRQTADNFSEFFRFNDVTNQYEHQSNVRTGQLSFTTIAFGTAFIKYDPKNYSSKVFENMRNIRGNVSTIVAASNTNSVGSNNGFANGYDGVQQEVLIGSFIAAYTDRNPSKKVVNPFKNVPLPNWNITYNGLAKMPFAKKLLKNFVLKHGYSSTVNIAGIQTNLNGAKDANGNLNTLDLNGNFINDRQIQNIVISERFNPLIGFDATWNIKGQGLITKFEIKKDRTATMSLNNNQITEVLGTEYVIGTGYKWDKVKIKIGGKKIESPINLRLDLSIRDNLTVIRRIVENNDQATAGQNVISIKSSADYNLSQNLTVQFYYDQVITNPKVLTSYPTGNLSAGIRIRFNLAGI